MLEPKMDTVLLFVANPQKSALFYQDILGIKPIEESADFVMFILKNGIILALWSRYAPEAQVVAHPGAHELCFSVNDVDAVYEIWNKKHVTILIKPVEDHVSRSFVALDPDGHRIRIYKLIEH